MFVSTPVSVRGMWARRELLWLWVAVVAALVAALSLLAPWARSGQVDRSMFELISSARALDLLSGFEVVLVGAAVVGVTVSASAGLLAASWDRPRMAALSLVASGPILIVASVVVSRTPLRLAWGAIGGSTAGAIASICAMMLLFEATTET